MKINCGPSAGARRRATREDYFARVARLQNWHPHFALWPTRVDENDCRWLEWIERRWLPQTGEWGFVIDELHRAEYRAKQVS